MFIIQTKIRKITTNFYIFFSVLPSFLSSHHLYCLRNDNYFLIHYHVLFYLHEDFFPIHLLLHPFVFLLLLPHHQNLKNFCYLKFYSKKKNKIKLNLIENIYRLFMLISNTYQIFRINRFYCFFADLDFQILWI